MADAATLTFAFMRSHPAEAARVLEGPVTAGAVDLFTRAPARIGSVVLAQMLPRTAARLLLALPGERAAELMAQLPAQSAVAILRHIEQPSRSQFIAALPTTTALAVKLLLEYIADSVGACMDPNVVTLPIDARAQDALDRARNVESPTDRVFVIDGERRLLGWIPLATVMRAPHASSLEALLIEPPARLAAHAPLAGARAHPAWLQVSVLPVVDRGGRLIGELTRDALDRAWQRALRTSELSGAGDSLAGILVQGYWQGFSGLLELLASCLPTVPATAPRSDER